MATIIKCEICDWAYVIVPQKEPLARLYMISHVRKEHGFDSGHIHEEYNVDDVPLSDGTYIRDD